MQLTKFISVFFFFWDSEEEEEKPNIWNHMKERIGWIEELPLKHFFFFLLGRRGERQQQNKESLLLLSEKKRGSLVVKEKICLKILDWANYFSFAGFWNQAKLSFRFVKGWSLGLRRNTSWLSFGCDDFKLISPGLMGLLG